MATCTETNKAKKAAKELSAQQTQRYTAFKHAITQHGFTAALKDMHVETGLKQSRQGGFFYEVYLFGKTGKPVPPRVWVQAEKNGDAEVQDIADHRGH